MGTIKIVAFAYFPPKFMQKFFRLAIALLFIVALFLAQPALAKSSHSTSSSHHKSSSSSAHKSSTSNRHSSTASSFISEKAGNCDYPEQLDSAGRRCGKRAASVRAGGRLGGYR